MTQQHSEVKASETPSLILGTAGHIDHGKSSLVLALTGTDPDRLAEEKQRGITITLGFAQLMLPNGRTMGVVDVPGHEKFIKHMIAGATGIDIALLVIAADDGIMPQTLEHVAVLQTLDIETCVVALTKADAVDSEWLSFMKGETEAWLSTTAYAGALVVPVSSKTGAGLDELLRALQKAADTTRHRTTGTHVRLPIDRVFTIKGAGTVVTGTLWSGTLHPDDEVEVLPHHLRTRVRSVQIHNQAVSGAPAGNRVALNLAGVKREEIKAGDFLVAPGAVQETDRFDALLTFMDVANKGTPLKTGARMHIAHGTREVIGRVLLCDGATQLMPNASSLVQIRLETPLPVCFGDRFIVRTYSPVVVAGGGEVLIAHASRRTNLTEGEHVLMDALEAHDLQTAVEQVVALSPLPRTAAEIAYEIGCELSAVEHALNQAQAAKRLACLGVDEGVQVYISPQLERRIISSIERALQTFHQTHPAERGIGKRELAARCAPSLSAARFDLLIAAAVAAKKAQVKGNLVSHPSSKEGIAIIEEEAATQIACALQAGGMTPEDLPHLLARVVPDASLASRSLARLEKEGRVVRISKTIAFDADVLDAHKQAMCAWLEEHGTGTVAELKEPLETSRKYAVPLLEHFDRTGVTVREGDLRRLY